MAPLDLDPSTHVRGLDAARRLLAVRAEPSREPMWRPLLAAALMAVAALGLCAVVFANGPPDRGASDGALGLRQPLAR